MGNSLLVALGQEAFLRDGEPCRVNIEHGVQVTGLDDNDMVVERSIATIDMSMNPKPGDRLVHPDGIYRLEAPFQKNGINKRFILLPLEA